MPSLTDVYLPFAFLHIENTAVIESSCAETVSQIDIGALYVSIPFPSYEYCMSILDGSDEVTDLVIGSRVCPFENVTVLDLSVYPRLKTLVIGNNGFEYVTVFNITGLSELESVEIGMNSFTHDNSESEETPDPIGSFFVKNCPKLKSLKIGKDSFSEYTVIEIESVDALEVIEMGELDKESYSFYYASLELKSILIHNE